MKDPLLELDKTAALWVAKLDYGLTPGEQDEFLEWLTADPQHGEALSRQKSSWSRLDLLADWRPEHAARPNRDLLAPATPKPSRPRSQILYFSAWFLAAAAAVTIAFVNWTRPAPPAAPAAIAAIEQRVLADGSVIELNRGAELSVAYTGTERRVRLERGEASFQVAKNHERPFIVSAAGVETRAVGTAFNVRLTTHAVEVLVTEGKVQVQAPPTQTGAPSAPTYVSEGERTEVLLAAANPPQVSPVTPDETERLLAWQPKWLDFTEAPLQFVVDEFNRRNAPIQLVISDPEISATIVNASIRSDNVENLLSLLEGSFGVHADREGNTITLRRARRD
jgi:transmembrane sensor